jgi:acyl-CoA thioester hydrolase
VHARHPTPPVGAKTTRLEHRVAFHETDAMGIMHHASYLFVLERARVAWLDEHDIPYREYVARDLHFAVRGVDVRYRRAVRFDDRIETLVWVAEVGGASLSIGYELRCAGELVATAITDHALVDGRGVPLRIPTDRRKSLSATSGEPR